MPRRYTEQIQIPRTYLDISKNTKNDQETIKKYQRTNPELSTIYSETSRNIKTISRTYPTHAKKIVRNNRKMSGYIKRYIKTTYRTYVSRNIKKRFGNVKNMSRNNKEIPRQNTEISNKIKKTPRNIKNTSKKYQEIPRQYTEHVQKYQEAIQEYQEINQKCREHIKTIYRNDQ